MDKKGTDMVQWNDIFGSLILTIILIFILSIVISNASSNQMGNTQLPVKIGLISVDEKFMVFLRSVPFKQGLISSDNENLIFDNGKSYKNINFDINKLEKNTVIYNGKEGISSANLILVPGYGSNIAVIKGSSDNIIDYFESQKIYPILIDWEDLDDDFDVLFVGCSSPLPPNPEKVKDWIQKGGRLIATDHSLEILENIYGSQVPIESSKENLPISEAEISFTSEGEKFNGVLNFDKDIISLFWPATIKTGRSGDVVILAEYEERVLRDESKYGYPFYKLGFLGDVYYFSGHLDDNLNELSDNFIDNLFVPKGEVPKDIFIDLGDNGNTEIQISGKLNEEKIVDLKGHIDNYFLSNCVSAPCSFPFTISGSSGKVRFKEMVISKKKLDMTTAGYKSTIADAIVYEYYNNKEFKLLENDFERFFDSYLYVPSNHGYLLSLKDKDGKVMYEYEEGNFKKNSVSKVGAINLPLREPNEYINIELLFSASK